MYGAAFGRQWEGTNLAEVKAIWAEKLGGFSAFQIGEALKICEDVKGPDGRSFPPNLPEFLDMCRRAARRDATATYLLPEPEITDEAIAARQRQMEGLTTKPDAYDYRLWAKRLREDYLAGVCLLPIQISMASEVMNEVWNKRSCVPKEQL